MSMSRASLPKVLLGLAAAGLAALAVGVFVCAGGGAQGPALGTPATPAQIAGWDISIMPDGRGLPEGSGTARKGAEVFAEKCASCHGVNAQGRSAESLAGGIGTLAGDYPEQTVGSYWPYAPTLFDYVRRAMPPTAPFSLSADELYSVCAFVLNLNRLIGPDDELTAANLPKIEMPNRNGFIQIYKEGKETMP